MVEVAEKDTWVGRNYKRKEDPRLLQGLATYVDDLRLPGLLTCMFVRSTEAHARIRGIDASRAGKLEGVVGVWTGADLKEELGPLPVAASLPDMKVPAHYCLAVEEVNYAGEPLACVVAESRAAARDALDRVEVDLEPLVPVVDPEEALREGAPRVHREFEDNRCCVWRCEGGEVEEAFARAHRVVKQRLLNPRVIPCAMEPRGVAAHYHAGEELLTVWTSTQIPHLVRTQLAAILGLPENRLRVVAPEVGGGFGSKLNVYAEEAVVAWLARRLGRPVRWTESRRENFTGTTHGRGQVADVEMALREDGTVLGIRCRVVADLGAYLQLLTPAIPTLTGMMLTGAYRIPALKAEVVGVFTNKMSTDAYRGAGRPEATYLIERMMDLAAAELGLDPAEIRRRNFPGPGDFPYDTPAGLRYDSGNYARCLDRALEKVDYGRFRREQERARREGKLLGVGLSSYVEICAMGPSAQMPAGGWECGQVRVDRTGRVTLLTGASPHGQGQETSFAQIAADFLGLHPDEIAVLHGDTWVIPYGIGTFGSRATTVGGSAILRALERIREKGRALAAHLMGVEPGQVTFEGGVFRAPGKERTLAEVAAAAYNATSLPEGMEPGLEATAFFEPPNYTFPFGTHAVIVEVDPETGEWKILRYVAVDDCGRVINPLLVEGQIHGGIAQGLGQVLFEEAVYDESGQLLTGEFTDYAIPRAAHMPWIETDRFETPSPANPLGTKGVGEAGTIGSCPAVVNAVVDALRHLGVRHLDMPLKPEKVWKALRGARQGTLPQGREAAP